MPSSLRKFLFYFVAFGPPETQWEKFAKSRRGWNQWVWRAGRLRLNSPSSSLVGISPFSFFLRLLRDERYDESRYELPRFSLFSRLNRGLNIKNLNSNLVFFPVWLTKIAFAYLNILVSIRLSNEKEMSYRGAGYKTWHKIAVRSYKQPFGGKIFKKRGLINDHFWDGNFKWGLIKSQIWKKTICRES